MKLCKVSDLVGDEIIARDVMTLDYKVILTQGTVVKKDYIDKLNDMGISEVYVDDGQPDQETVQLLKEEIKNSFKDTVKNILERHTYSRNEELAQLVGTADGIISSILEEERVVERIYDIKERSTDIYEHSINICSLSTVLALKLGFSRDRVHDIGVSCLLHDIGLRYLTSEYENRDMSTIAPAAYVEYKKHPVYGYSALRNENWISNASKNMILYHHERKDGSGFPLKATDIPKECEIIQICDAFDEMICGLGCERMKVYEAIEYLKTFRGIKFSSDVVDLFLEFTAVFPSGSIIITNEGETGVVLHQNDGFPDRPVIRITKDSRGKKVDIIKDLLQINNIYIEKVIE